MSIRTIGLGIGMLILIGGAVFWMMYNKPHRDVTGEQPVYTLTADSLFQTFVNNDSLANALYLDKVLEVEGSISEIENDGQRTSLLVLQTTDDFAGVNVYLDSSVVVNNLKIGTSVNVIGRCTGGDDLGVVLTQSRMK